MTDSAKYSPSGSDTAAFEALYVAHHRTVLAYCARRALRSDAWDAAAEVFTVAWRRLNDVPSGDDARPWLLGVAYKVLSNQRRSAQRRRRLTSKSAGTAATADLLPEAQLIRNEEEAEVIASLAQLRPRDREILQLSLWEELRPEEIACVLGISRGAVDQRYSRAKRRLARQLTRYRQIEGRATRITTERGGAT
ncbi:MAG: sigma-70 family RNA polymerase sigma factor [bacterium]|nr:sigma-70 family RNA polymerase sigma factor [bacterium]